MSLTITHTFVSSKADGTDTTVVRPSDWNADHTLTGFPDDATLYLDGTGSFSTPPGSGGGGFDLTADHNFSGKNAFFTSLISYTPTFPLAVVGSIQGAYGYVGAEFTSSGSESGLQIVNSGTDGRTYSLLSTSDVSTLGGGFFAIGDATAGQVRMSIDNTGTVAIPGKLQLGAFPDCDNAQVTIYQTMSGSTNSSMVDVVAFTSGSMSQVTAFNILVDCVGTVSGAATALYIRTDANDPGASNNSTIGIKIDSPSVSSGSLGSIFGLWIADQSGITNFYSEGRDSKNFFEGVLTQSPFGQQQSGTITDGGSSSDGQSIVGSGTFFTTQVCAGDIITDGLGNVGQVINIPGDGELFVWPPNSFTGVSDTNIFVYPSTVRLVDQLTNQGMSFAFNQSAWVISGFSGLDASPCNFVIGSPTNMVNGETQFSAVLGGNNNTVSSSQSVIIGGINNVITGNQSVVLAGDAMTVSGNEVVATSLSSNAWTVAQSNCFIIMDGNVGIGTVAPAFALEVVGDVHVSAAILHIDDSKWIDFRDTDTNWSIGYMPDGGAFSMTNISTAMQHVIGSGSTDGWAVGQTGGNSILELKGSDRSAWFSGDLNFAGTLKNAGTAIPIVPPLPSDNTQFLNGDGAWSVPGSDNPITTTNTDLRLLVDLTDPQYGSGADLRVFRFGGEFQGSGQSANTTWFSMPQLPVGGTNDWTTTALSCSISFQCFYYLYNSVLSIGTEGMVKGRIEYVAGSWNIANETTADTSGSMTFVANPSSGNLQFAFLDAYSDSNTVAQLTIHYVAEAFTSPEYYC